MTRYQRILCRPFGAQGRFWLVGRPPVVHPENINRVLVMTERLSFHAFSDTYTPCYVHKRYLHKCVAIKTLSRVVAANNFTSKTNCGKGSGDCEIKV